MRKDTKGIAGISGRLFKARKLLSAHRGHTVTQAQIGDAVGVTEGQIGHWENGRQMPDLPMIEKLAAALEVEAVWIAYGMAGAPAVAQPDTINIGGLEIERDSIVRFSDEELAADVRTIAEQEAREQEKAAPASAPRKAAGKKPHSR